MREFFGEDRTAADDLALVRSCVDGDPEAWEVFISRHRNTVFAAALAIAKETSAAQDLADSLWAELYGTAVDANGKRISKLAAYTGRGSLAGWLRTLVAQEYVNRFRQGRRFVPFNESTQSQCHAQTLGVADVSPDPRIDVALDQALSELSEEERLILAAHYLDDRSLAEVGKMLGLHESTVGRRVKKSTTFLRRRTAHILRKCGMTLREAEEALHGDVEQISLDVRKHLLLAKDVP